MHLALPPVAVGRLSGLSPPVQGALWMCAAATAFAVMINLVRHLTDLFDPLQVVFFRNVFGLLAMLPWLARSGVGVLRTRRLGLHMARAAVAMAAMVLWFTTLSLMPLAEATALSFTAPMFTSLLAVLVLGEVMRARRWTAIGIAFIGALVIIRPGSEALDPVALLALVTALVWGTGTVMVKVMSRTESAGAIVTWVTLLLTPLSLIPALFVWITPTAEQLIWCALLGVAGSIGHLCLTRALKVADATVVVPFDYLRLPVVAVIAFVVFGEQPDLWTWIGGAIVAGSGIYIARREASLGVSPPTAGSPAPQV
ncbi:MAG: DMT family transporter [Geminicoccaceae bacterium]|nr:DMT family transporter [Geminicoccaceae bacterium]